MRPRSAGDAIAAGVRPLETPAAKRNTARAVTQRAAIIPRRAGLRQSLIERLVGQRPATRFIADWQRELEHQERPMGVQRRRDGKREAVLVRVIIAERVMVVMRPMMMRIAVAMGVRQLAARMGMLKRRRHQAGREKNRGQAVTKSNVMPTMHGNGHSKTTTREGRLAQPTLQA